MAGLESARSTACLGDCGSPGAGIEFSGGNVRLVKLRNLVRSFPESGRKPHPGRMKSHSGFLL